MNEVNDLQLAITIGLVCLFLLLIICVTAVGLLAPAISFFLTFWGFAISKSAAVISAAAIVMCMMVIALFDNHDDLTAEYIDQGGEPYDRT